MSKPINSIVIVGGGTAGWLCAAYLANVLPQKRKLPLQVTLVESPDVQTIGVGEGTWPTMRATLQRIGISETRFMRECNATFKQASKFVNWRQNPTPLNKDFYYHLFDAPSLSWPISPVPFWLEKSNDASFADYADAISVQQHVCENNLSPKLATTPEYEGLLHYAYHLDAGKFAALLQDVATNELGVKHQLANVTAVNVNEEGYIASLDTDRVGQINGDFFIDCTGFACRLLGQALDVPFKDYSDILLTDRAVVMQVPYQEDNDVKPYTQSTAQRAGWIWDIGLTHRRGTGYVYSSRHCSDQEAEQTLRQYNGAHSTDLTTRLLKIRSGRREQIWSKNCMAIGLSAAFMEPLEASAIFLIEASCYMLTDLFPSDFDELDYIADKFNDSFAYRWDKVVEFIKLHYVLSGRTDSDFWLDNKDPNTWPQGFAEKLTRWQTATPSQYEFNHAFEPFTKESYEFILFGMQQRKQLEKVAAYKGLHDAQADYGFKLVKERKQRVNEALVKHRELLTAIQTNAFPVTD